MAYKVTILNTLPTLSPAAETPLIWYTKHIKDSRLSRTSAMAATKTRAGRITKPPEKYGFASEPVFKVTKNSAVKKATGKKTAGKKTTIEKTTTKASKKTATEKTATKKTAAKKKTASKAKHKLKSKAVSKADSKPKGVVKKPVTKRAPKKKTTEPEGPAPIPEARIRAVAKQFGLPVALVRKSAQYDNYYIDLN